MNLITRNFSFKHKSYGGGRNTIFLIVLLYFSELILGLFGSSLPQNSTYKIFLVLSFGAVFSLFCITYIIKSNGKFLSTSLFITYFSFFSLLLGFINGWYLTDILGDAARFLAPFIAYFLGKKLFAKLDLDQIKISFMMIMKGLLFIVLYEVLFRLFGLIVLGEPLVKYPDGGVDVPVILFSFFVIAWYYIYPRRSFSYFVITLFMLTLLAPMMSASKSSFITVAFSVIFIPLVFGEMRHKLWTIGFLLLGIYFISTNQLAMILINRLIIAFNIIFNSGTSDVIGDMSSYARIIEYQSALNGLVHSDFFPLSFLIGTGSGSLWYAIVDTGSGLNLENFRGDGGAHHIHIEVMSLLFRHGLIGLFIYVGWVFYVARKAYLVSKYYLRRDIFIMCIAASVVVVLMASFIVMLSNTSVYGHFTVGLIAALPVVLYERVTSVKNASHVKDGLVESH